MTAKISDEKLSCYLDGELPPEDMERIEQAIQKDDELKLRLEKLARTDELWQQALAVTQDGDIPQNIIDMLSEDVAQPVNDNVGFRKWLLPVAASLAFVFGLTFQSVMDSSPDKFDSMHLAGQIQPGSPIYSILESTPSAQNISLDEKTGLVAKPVLTFATNDGNFCREFIIGTQASATRNVACRAEDSWEVLITSRTKPIAENQYQTVGAETDQTVDLLIDEIIDGIPFDNDQERELLHSAWEKN